MSDQDDEIEQELEHVVEDDKFSVPTVNNGQVSQAAHQGTLITWALTPNNPLIAALGRDYQRTAVYITAVDAPIMIATTKDNAQGAIAQGAQPAEGTATPMQSSSGYVPQGIAYPWMNCDMLYIALIGNVPTRVSIQVCRRLEESAPRG